MVIMKIENDFKALKKALGNGYTIQAWRHGENQWVDLKKPNWSPKTQYRVKPGALGLLAEHVASNKRDRVRYGLYLALFLAGSVSGYILRGYYDYNWY